MGNIAYYPSEDGTPEESAGYAGPGFYYKEQIEKEDA